MALIISLLYKYLLITFFVCFVGLILCINEEITVGEWVGYTVIWPVVIIVFICKSVKEVLK